MLFPVGLKPFSITGSRTVDSTDGWISRQFTNSRHRGVRITVTRSAETGTATMTVILQYKDDVGGTWIDLEGATIPVFADGVTESRSLTVYPGITAADADANIALDTDNDQLCGHFLPRHWRVNVATTGTTNVFSIAGTYLP